MNIRGISFYWKVKFPSECENMSGNFLYYTILIIILILWIVTCMPVTGLSVSSLHQLFYDRLPYGCEQIGFHIKGIYRKTHIEGCLYGKYVYAYIDAPFSFKVQRDFCGYIACSWRERSERKLQILYMFPIPETKMELNVGGTKESLHYHTNQNIAIHLIRKIWQIISHIDLAGDTCQGDSVRSSK